MINYVGCCESNAVFQRARTDTVGTRLGVVQTAVLQLGKLQRLLGDHFGGVIVAAPEGHLPRADKIEVQLPKVAPLLSELAGAGGDFSSLRSSVAFRIMQDNGECAEYF